MPQISEYGISINKSILALRWSGHLSSAMQKDSNHSDTRVVVLAQLSVEATLRVLSATPTQLLGSSAIWISCRYPAPFLCAARVCLMCSSSAECRHALSSPQCLAV